MEYEFDYYFLENTYEDNEPLLKVDDEVDPTGVSFLSLCQEIPLDYVAHLCLGEPFSPVVNLNVDGFSLRGYCSVFSKKIYDAVNPHNFKNLQYVSAVIRGKDDEEYDDFYIANICNKMYSFDPEGTEYMSIGKSTGSWDGIDSIALSKELLSKVPLDERLVFVSAEHSGFRLYHKKIVDLIMATNPESIIAIPVEDWYQGMEFE